MNIKQACWCLGLLTFINTGILATGTGSLMDDFSKQPESRWEFITDQVMGGVSTGQVKFEAVDGRMAAHLTGKVSTVNRGGFIQFRSKLDTPLTDTLEGVWLTVKGNGEPYFVHLRTSGTILPWQYYQAEFQTTGEWQTIRLPFSAFKPSGTFLRETPKPSAVRSVGIVAFGKDYQADLWVQAVGFY